MGAGRKKENFDRARVEFKADPAWIERMARKGERLGLNLSALIRMVMTQWADQEDQAEAARKPDRRGTRS